MNPVRRKADGKVYAVHQMMPAQVAGVTLKTNDVLITDPGDNGLDLDNPGRADKKVWLDGFELTRLPADHPVDVP